MRYSIVYIAALMACATAAPLDGKSFRIRLHGVI